MWSACPPGTTGKTSGCRHVADLVDALADLLDRPGRLIHPGRFGDHHPGHPSGDRGQRFAGDGAVLVRQPADHGRHQLRSHRRVGGGVEALGHPRHRAGDDHVAPHAVLGAFQCHDVGQADDPRLGRRVVGHVVVSVQPADRGGEHHPAVPGRTHHRERRAHHVERSAQVDVEDGVEVVVAHLRQRRAQHVARIVDQDVQAAIVFQRRGDDGLTALGRRDGLGTGGRLAAGRADLVAPPARPASCVAVRRVVDDDLGALGGQQQGVLAAQSAAGAGDDRNPVVESQAQPSSRVPGRPRSPLSRHSASNSSNA